MIASLLSEDNRWINAERIEVTGGYVYGRQHRFAEQTTPTTLPASQWAYDRA